MPGKSHGQRSLAGYGPWGCKRVGHDLATKQQQIVRGKRTCFSKRVKFLIYKNKIKKPIWRLVHLKEILFLGLEKV